MKKIAQLIILLAFTHCMAEYSIELSSNNMSEVEKNKLVDIYNEDVNQKALAETLKVLQEQRQAAISNYEKNRTVKNSAVISTYDSALRHLQDPDVAINSFYNMPFKQPELIILKDVLTPIVEGLNKEFSAQHKLNNKDMSDIQNIFDKKHTVKLFENRYFKPKFTRAHSKNPQQEFDKWKLRKGFNATKSVNPTKPHYNSSLPQINWRKYLPVMPTREKTFERIQKAKAARYDPAPKSARKALKQDELFGTGGYQY